MSWELYQVPSESAAMCQVDVPKLGPNPQERGFGCALNGPQSWAKKGSLPQWEQRDEGIMLAVGSVVTAVQPTAPSGIFSKPPSFQKVAGNEFSKFSPESAWNNQKRLEWL